MHKCLWTTPKAYSDAKATMTVMAVSTPSAPDSDRLGSSASPPCGISCRLRSSMTGEIGVRTIAPGLSICRQWAGGCQLRLCSATEEYLSIAFVVATLFVLCNCGDLRVRLQLEVQVAAVPAQDMCTPALMG